MKNKSMIIFGSILSIILVIGVVGYFFLHKEKPTSSSAFTEDEKKELLTAFRKTPSNFLPPNVSDQYYVAKSNPFSQFIASPVWVVVFSDFYCPHCQRTDKALKEIIEEPEFNGKVSVMQYFFPLNKNCNDAITKENGWPEQSCPLTYMAMADANKFERVSSDIWLKMDQQFNFTNENIQQLANAFNITPEQVNDSKPKLKNILEAIKAYEKMPGSDGGIHSTPTLIINGRMIHGLTSEKEKDALKMYFREVLGQQK